MFIRKMLCYYYIHPTFTENHPLTSSDVLTFQTLKIKALIGFFLPFFSKQRESHTMRNKLVVKLLRVMDERQFASGFGTH